MDWPGIWGWIKDNSELFGVGVTILIALVAGGWALFIYFHQKDKSSGGTTLTVPGSGVAIGASVSEGAIVIGTLSGGTFNAGPSDAHIEDIVRRTLAQESSKEKQIEELSQALGIRDQAVASFFDTLKQEKISPERWAERFAEIAQLHLRLIQDVRVLRSDDPAIRRLRDEALAALEKGDNAKAEAALVEARALVRQKRERLAQALAEQAIEEGKLEGALGDLAMKQLRYPVAAQHYAAAAALMPPGHKTQRLAYLDLESRAHYRQGNEFGDNLALLRAITNYRALLTDRPRQQTPFEWAMTQMGLGNALAVLGERESDTQKLLEAVEAYRSALEVYTRERVPSEWAAIQNNLGNTLRVLGERTSDIAKLAEAVECYRQALLEHTKQKAPLAWATAQNNLGNALLVLSKREPGTESLMQAVSAYFAALEERTRERMPLQWATTMNNLGLALATLGERGNDTHELKKAVAIYQEALQERIRERVPLDWAATQANLANAYFKLSEREIGTGNLVKAIDANRLALQEFTRERVPLKWALTQRSLGLALAALGERMGDRGRIKEAIQAFRFALAVFETAGASHYANQAKANLDLAERLLRELTQGGQAARR